MEKELIFIGKSLFLMFLIVLMVCNKTHNYKPITFLLEEQQLTFSAKTHDLDNNDNFSPDSKFLCYDTRGTVYSESIANSKTIEKVEIATGRETMLYNPPSVTGEKAAPGVGAVSWHPYENKVIFIHGPLMEDVAKYGYYGKPNRTGAEVMADGNGKMIRTDLRDVAVNRPTVSGAHRGGTHRHEYSRSGNRIGFTYDDYLLPQFGRTIGYMETHEKAPKGFNYFAILIKPKLTEQAQPGDIVHASADSWVDSDGRMRAFIGTVRAENGIDFQDDLFIVEIPDSVDIATAQSGTASDYPEPPRGVVTKRLTHDGQKSGIVRGAADGTRIAFFGKDERNINQLFIIAADGSDKYKEKNKRSRQLTQFTSDSYSVRWHPSNNWLFFLNNGNLAAVYVGEETSFGQIFWLTQDNKQREKLVVSPDGNMLAYMRRVPTEDEKGKIVKDVEGKDFRQIFIMSLDIRKFEELLIN